MLEFCVENQIVTRIDGFRVVSDSKNYLKAHFVLSDEWTDNVAVLFGYGDECFCVLLDESGDCVVPHEVIKPPFFTVSLLCGQDMLVTANVVNVNVEKSGLKDGKTPQTPSKDLWQQYVCEMHEIIKKGVPYVGENNHWFLYNPTTEQYEDSEISAMGTLPVCGVDYWTEEDKKKMLDDVLAALPDADEMSFPLEETVSEVTGE